MSNDDTFALTTTNETLLAFLSSALVLIDEAKVHLEDNGLQIRGVDPANVGMIDLDLSSDAFEKYHRANRDLIGLNIERLEEFLKQPDPSEVVTISFNPESEKLQVKTENGLEMTMSPIDPDSIRMEPDLPDLDLPASITLNGDDLNRGITAADMVSDHVRLGVDSDAEAFFMEAEGDTDDVEMTIDDEDYEALDTSETASSLFSLDYLKDFKSLIGKQDTINLELGNEFPLIGDIHMEDHEHLDTTIMLAPRIESD